MANPDSLVSGQLAVLVSSTAEQTIPVSVNRNHTLYHHGEDASGVADTEPIYFACVDPTVAGMSNPAASYVSPNYQPGGNKFILKSGTSVILRAGFTHIKFRTAAGAPVFGVSPGDHQFGLV